MHACTLRLLRRSSTKHRCTTTQLVHFAKYHCFPLCLPTKRTQVKLVHFCVQHYCYTITLVFLLPHFNLKFCLKKFSQQRAGFHLVIITATTK
jgi:hypothetical protein